MSNTIKKLQELETENSTLKTELIQAQATIKSLQQENLFLSKRLASYKGDSILSYDSTFITSQFLDTICENCEQEIPFSDLDIHTAECIKSTTRCQVCNEKLTKDDLDVHIKSQVGDVRDLTADIENGDISSLEMRIAHGAQVNCVSLDDMCNTMVHIAVRSGRTELVEYLLRQGLDVNSRNAFGEVPLHLACGRQKDIMMVKYLVAKGAYYHLKNSLGDSCIDLAQRNGFHEAVLYFQQSKNIR